MDLINELMQHLQKDEPEMIKIRRHLHEHPEVSFHEKNVKYIKNSTRIWTARFGTAVTAMAS